jgi:pimeloyl-ACP methyl ester carboxylesterase
VQVPRALLATEHPWTVRVASGVANADGTGFAPVDSDHGALPGQPAVFNVGFRDVREETPASNFWMESAQANALASGDVSAFKTTVDWAALDAGAITPELMPTGYSNRWYVSSLGANQQGVVKDSGNSTEDLRPNFLGRVQPYAVYVPTTYDPATPTPLTWMLHSLSVQHNQYGALNGTFITQACEDRHSICATTLGRGPDGWYYDEAEVDFWEVWNRLAMTYTLDPAHTVLSGYSMGGWATYKLGLAHPDLFAKAVVLAGPPLCGLRLAQGAGGAAGPGPCTTDGDSSPLIENARWLPYYIAHGTSDELVPVSGVLQQVKFFDDLGYRYRFELYPGQDHLAWAAEGMWPSAVAHMANDGVTKQPPRVTLSWYPYLDRTDHPEWGIGTTGAYWIHNPKAATATPGSTARVDAVSTALAAPTYTPQHVPDAVLPGQPTPGVVVEQTWQAGAPTAAGTTLSLTFRNVATVTVDLRGAGAGFAPGTPVTVSVQTAAPVVITFVTSTGDQTISAVANSYTITA